MDGRPVITPPIMDCRSRPLWDAAQTDEERLALVRACMDRAGRKINIFVPSYAVWFLLDYVEHLQNKGGS